MAGLEVTVRPNVIDWIMQHIRDEHIDNKLLERLQSWRDGRKKPTLKQLEDASKKTHIPFGYFLLKTPPVEKISMANYRTIDSTSFHDPSRNLIDIIDQMELIQDWMKEYLQNEGMEPLNFVGSLTKPYDETDIARRIRHALDVSSLWYKEVNNVQNAFSWWRHRLMMQGIMVFVTGIVGNNTHRKLNLREFRGFTLIDNYAPLIFINSADTYTGRLFTLLHENVHIWLGENNLFNRLDWQNKPVRPTETICNAVAAELLVPEKEFLKLWEPSCDLKNHIEDLANVFHCSKFVITRRALDLGKIEKDTYTNIVHYFYRKFQQLETEKKDKKSGGSYYQTQKFKLDTRFMEALHASVNEGKTQCTDAYKLTGLNRKTFTNVWKKMGDEVW